MSKYLLIIIMILGGALAFLWNRFDKVTADRDRIKMNQTVLIGNLTHYKLRDSLNAISIQGLTLSRDEIKEECTELMDLLSDMSIKVKRLESSTTTAIKTVVKADNIPIMEDKTPMMIIDTIIRAPLVQAFEWNNAWTEVYGEIIDDRVNLEVFSRDTLQQIIHRVPRKVLGFIPWGTKYIQQEIVSMNPDTEIVYSEHLRFAK
ncbi:MAG: DUF6549 family protein [Rikenellaceae bacterium]